MAKDDKSNKTEKPTQHKKKEAKKKGQTPRSKELNNAFNLLMIIFFFYITMSYFGNTLIKLVQKYYSFGSLGGFNIKSMMTIQKDSFFSYLQLMSPLFVILIASTFFSHVIQGGFKITSENLRIKFSKFNIVEGLKKIFSSFEGMMELVKSLLKVAVIGTITFFTIKNNFDNIAGALKTNIPTILKLMGSIFFKLVFNVTIFLLILSIVDYFIQKKQFIKNLKMSKNDIREERKQLEGDPIIKGKQRQVMMQRAMARMMHAVPEADVVITNPDHYAVALKYDGEAMGAPKVVAKGKNLIAEKIKEVAKENKVPLVENKFLARSLYTAVDLNGFVPENLFKPVAEILAYIYKLRKKGMNYGH